MSEVALSIGGRTWRVACAPGEEDRVQRLGATVAEKLEAMGAKGAADAQNMLFAALLLADEVLEGRETVASASGDIEAARREAASAAEERDRMRGRITELESELNELHGAQQSGADELARALSRNEELGATLAGHESELATLRDDLFEARKERDAARASAGSGAAELSVEDATLALQRFAEMLEECADKLESRGNAS